MNIEEVRKKLGGYNPNDIVFLKKHWQEWINNGKFDLIEEKTGANVQAVYNILDSSKIKSINPAKYYNDRYEIRLNHSVKFEIAVIISFDQPKKGSLGIVTYYKRLITK